MSAISRTELTLLYNSGKSMAEIAKLLNYSQHTVVYWMKKYNIKRRTYSDATYIKRNPNGDPFSIKRIKTINNAMSMV